MLTCSLLKTQIPHFSLLIVLIQWCIARDYPEAPCDVLKECWTSAGTTIIYAEFKMKRKWRSGTAHFQSRWFRENINCGVGEIQFVASLSTKTSLAANFFSTTCLVVLYSAYEMSSMYKNWNRKDFQHSFQHVLNVPELFICKFWCLVFPYLLHYLVRKPVFNARISSLMTSTCLIMPHETISGFPHLFCMDR
jgi:hypothetical protein